MEPTATVGPTHIGTVTQSPSECTLDAVDGPISTGRVSFNAVNDTAVFAGFDMWRIAEGHSYEELAAAIQEARRNAEAGGAVISHPEYLSGLIQVQLQPGESKVMAGRVQPGTYAIVCIRMFEQVGEPRPFSILGPIEVR